MGLLSESVLNAEGKCSECVHYTTNDDTLQCDVCKNSYHVFCEGLDTGEKHCTKTFLTQFIAKSCRKPNFSWKCDPCAIQRDKAEKTDLAQIVHKLASHVEVLTTAFETFTRDIKQDNRILTTTFEILKHDIKQDITAIQLPGPQPTTQGNPWTNTGAIQKLRSSFLVKPSVSGSKADMEKINKIVTDNNLQVNNIGVSQTGNTFIHCPTEDASKTLQTHIQTELVGHVVHSLQDPLPSISIAGVTKTEWDPLHVTPDGITNFIQRLRGQNPFLEGLMTDGESFKVIFMKPPSGDYKNFQIVARTSPKIRDAITARWNRLFIGSTSVRVYDRFYVKRCNKCNKFGHYKDKCENLPSCGICGADGHESETCDHKTETSRFSCVNCKRENLPQTGHNATSRKCPAYMTAQKKLKGNTPYYQGAKNMFRPSRQ